MYIEKRGNSYRVRHRDNGKTYSVTLAYKPSQKEAMRLITEQIENDPVTQQKAILGSVEYYAIKYISKCEKDNKSPSTVSGYSSILRNLSDDFKRIQMADVTNAALQFEIRNYGKTRSAKTVKNMYGFVKLVIADSRPLFKFNVNLPTGESRNEYEPATDDVRAILEYAKSKRYSVAFQLAVLGLRRGEVCALTIDDLDGNKLTINKAIALDKNNVYQIKEPKTSASNRTIILPDALVDEIRNQGYIFNGNPHTINEALHRYQDKLNIPRFKLHMFRHFCVAYLHQQGFTTEQIMAWGGWSSEYVMKRAYRYNLDPQESKTRMAESLSSIF